MQGFAFVHFSSQDAVSVAISKSGTPLRGRPLVIEASQPLQSHRGGGRGRGGRDGGGRGAGIRDGSGRTPGGRGGHGRDGGRGRGRGDFSGADAEAATAVEGLGGGAGGLTSCTFAALQVVWFEFATAYWYFVTDQGRIWSSKTERGWKSSMYSQSCRLWSILRTYSVSSEAAGKVHYRTCWLNEVAIALLQAVAGGQVQVPESRNWTSTSQRKRRGWASCPGL